MDRLLVTLQRVNAAHKSPNIVSHLGASVKSSHPPKRAPSFTYKTLSRSPSSLEYLFPYTQLVCPPPLLFCNLLI
jgi:hypothetical protein